MLPRDTSQQETAKKTGCVGLGACTRAFYKEVVKEMSQINWKQDKTVRSYQQLHKRHQRAKATGISEHLQIHASKSLHEREKMEEEDYKSPLSLLYVNLASSLSL